VHIVNVATLQSHEGKDVPRKYMMRAIVFALLGLFLSFVHQVFGMQTTNSQSAEHTLQKALAEFQELPLYRMLSVHPSATGEVCEMLDGDQGQACTNDGNLRQTRATRFPTQRSSSHVDRAASDHSPPSARVSATSSWQVDGRTAIDSPNTSAHQHSAESAREATVRDTLATQSDDFAALESSAVLQSITYPDSSTHLSQDRCADAAGASAMPAPVTHEGRGAYGHKVVGSRSGQGQSGVERNPKPDSQVDTVAVEAFEDDLEALLSAPRQSKTSQPCTSQSILAARAARGAASSVQPVQASGFVDAGVGDVSSKRESTDAEGRVGEAGPKGDGLESCALESSKAQASGLAKQIGRSQPEAHTRAANRGPKRSPAPRTVAELEDWLDLY
jgi:hypothetical protein